MKTLKILAILLPALASGVFISTLSAQTINLTGKIISIQGTAIRGAEVSFFTLQGGELGDCSTNSKGEFASERTFKPDQQIRIEVKATGFDTYTRELTLRTGRFGNITLAALSGVKGTVKSDQNGYVQGVIIYFYNQTGDKLMGTTVTDINGAYQSDKLYRAGETMLVRAKKAGFAERSETRKVDASGFVTLNFTLETRTIIRGFVLDSTNLEPIPGAEVSFYDKDGPLITTLTTDQRGYYHFDNAYNPGEIIRVHVDKKDYRPKEQTLRIVRPDLENGLDFKLVKKIDEGIKVIVRVYNGKGKKPLENAKITYQNRGSQEKITPRDGEVQFRINQRGGYDLPLRIRKPGYRELNTKQRLREDQDNYVDINLYKDKSICPCFLYGGVGLAAAGGASFWLAKGPYDSYKDFKNLNRQDDYDKANRYVRIGTVSALAAGTALAGWIICKAVEKTRIRKQTMGQGIGLRPFVPATRQDVQIGIAYTF